MLLGLLLWATVAGGLLESVMAFFTGEK